MARMSISRTLPAVEARQQTVIRRREDQWRDLRPGARLTLIDSRLTVIEPGMGLPTRVEQVVDAEVEVIAVELQTLRQVTIDEVEAEGLLDRALTDGHRFRDFFDDPETCAVAWFRGFWAACHISGQIEDWVIGRRSGALLGTPCRRIEWRYLDDQGPVR